MASPTEEKNTSSYSTIEPVECDTLGMDKVPDLIVGLRRRRGWDQTRLAKELSVSQATVSRWESGRQDPDYENLRALAGLDGKSVDEFLGYPFRVGSISLIPVRVVGSLKAGYWAEAVEWPPTEQFILQVPENKAYQGLTHRAYRVDGPSMNQRYPDGSYVIVVPYIELRRQPEVGDRVICQRKRGDGLYEATLKEYVTVNGKNFLWPRSHDPEHQAPLPADGNPGEDVTITGKVIGSYIPE